MEFGCALSKFLHTYRNVPHSTTGRSPAQILFGRALRTRLLFVLPCMSERVKEQLQPQEGLVAPRVCHQGEGVWIRDYRPNATSKWMSGTLQSSVGPLHYMVVTQSGLQRKAHIDHLEKRLETHLCYRTFTDIPPESTEAAERLDLTIRDKDPDSIMSQPLASLLEHRQGPPHWAGTENTLPQSLPQPAKDSARSVSTTETTHRAAPQIH